MIKVIAKKTARVVGIYTTKHKAELAIANTGTPDAYRTIEGFPVLPPSQSGAEYRALPANAPIAD